MSKIRKFIDENNITFTEGERNSNVVVCIGYALFLELTQEQLEDELADEISADSFIKEEIGRLFNYCKSKNYDKFWKKKSSKEVYSF